MTTNPYLTFNGNCKAAFDYYVQHLGAKLLMSMTYAEMPKSEAPSPETGCAPTASDKIMHARLKIGDSIVMGSDAPPGRFDGVDGFSISLNVETPQEAERYYAALSKDGEVFMPLGEAFWAQRFAMFKDQFGVPWMINCEKENY